MSTKVLVISDNHGNIDCLLKAKKNCRDQYDMVVHCGDSEMDMKMLQEVFGDVPIHVVQGNCDYGFDGCKDDIFEVEGHVCYLVHGHRQRVSWGLEELEEKACEYGADVVFFGHTHKPEYFVDWDMDITMLNPGSISWPRQEDRMRTYMVVEFRDDGQIVPMLSTLKGF